MNGFDHVRPEQAPDPAAPDGAAVLDDARSVLTTYCALPCEEAADAIVLWCAATHALPAVPSAPRLTITSPVKRAGKSRTLEIVHGLSHRALKTANATTAAIFRSLDGTHPPTLIFDEVDTIFGSRVVAERNEDLRGLLNAGFQRGWPALRCVGPQQVPTEFPTFAMAALAGIGGLPDTITDRAVNVRMRRRKVGETVKPFRERRDRPAITAVRETLAEWLSAPAVRAALEDAVPAMTLEDRAADVWEPLVMIADLAGGTWPERARAAAVRLTTESADDEQDDSTGIRLLHDLHDVFIGMIRAEWAPTAALLDHLRRIEDAPWRELDLNAHRLGAELRPFSIKSRRNTSGRTRGYRRADFTDAWERYPSPERSVDRSEPDPPSEASASVNTDPKQGKRSDASSDAFDTPGQASEEASARFRTSEHVLPLADASDGNPDGVGSSGGCDVCGAERAVTFETDAGRVRRCLPHHPQTYGIGRTA